MAMANNHSHAQHAAQHPPGNGNTDTFFSTIHRRAFNAAVVYAPSPESDGHANTGDAREASDFTPTSYFPVSPKLNKPGGFRTSSPMPRERTTGTSPTPSSPSQSSRAVQALLGRRETHQRDVQAMWTSSSPEPRDRHHAPQTVASRRGSEGHSTHGRTQRRPGTSPQVSDMATMYVVQAPSSRQVLWFDLTSHVTSMSQALGLSQAVRVWFLAGSTWICIQYEAQTAHVCVSIGVRGVHVSARSPTRTTTTGANRRTRPKCGAQQRASPRHHTTGAADRRPWTRSDAWTARVDAIAAAVQPHEWQPANSHARRPQAVTVCFVTWPGTQPHAVSRPCGIRASRCATPRHGPGAIHCRGDEGCVWVDTPCPGTQCGVPRQPTVWRAQPGALADATVSVAAC